MKIRNKKTGEIVEATDFNIISEFNSLTELNAEWEDYEEPKEFWFVDADGKVKETTYLTEADRADLKNFGNHFESQEEAENAVEKLKAWKRLIDKGFKFEGIKEDYTRILQHPIRTGKRYLQFNKSEDEEWIKDNKADLDLLFGGEE